jgi:NADP-dependent 3-hydroxy acid dehydrogenase YdfG
VRKLDVRDRGEAEAAVRAVRDGLGGIDVLVNDAGQARGLRPVEEGDETEWRDMVETNIMGLLWVTRATIPIMKAQGRGHIINLGSVAGHESYAGGSVYAGTKFAVRAIATALRHELLGTKIRISSVDPGLVETEFSLVRFDGDAERAKNVYRGMQPLTGADVAECIVFAASRPDHVNVDEIIVKPTAQAGSTAVHRDEGP